MNQPVRAHDPSRSNGAKTHYEEFAAAAGVLRVTEQFELPQPRVKYGVVDMALVRSRNTQSNDISLALRIGFTDGDGVRWVELLDEDEVVSLESALKYILQHREELIRRARTYTEIEYRSRGGFRMGMYVAEPADRRQEVGEFMAVQDQFAWFHSLAALAEVIDEALFKMESVRRAQS
jgi:hypothetical protein